ncbi:DUF2283 domain-containing protein [Corynebacterium camporealensis]
MKINYDREADAAYITLGNDIQPSEASQQVSLINTPNQHTQITLDFDSDGHLLGIEVLAASKGIRREILDKADPA